MEAKELRVGNLVEWIHPSFKKYYFKITDIGVVGVNQFTNHFRVFSELSGIPLTEEILLKCGLKKRNILFINDTIPFVKIVKCGDYFDVIIGNVFYVKLYSIHQLQNLYFALTGQELEINL